MFFYKKGKGNDSLSPQTPMQKAIKQRQDQHRPVLDEWDMFANVMATRNSLPKDHPSHLTNDQVVEHTVEDVHRFTGLVKPDSTSVKDIDAHASTGGGWHKAPLDVIQPTRLTVSKSYLEGALNSVTTSENTDPFRKYVRTISHEMTHVTDLVDPTMRGTGRPQMEMRAYGSELTMHPSLPALRGAQLQSTVNKFNKYASQASTTTGLTVEETQRQQNVQSTLVIGKGTGK